MLVWLNFSNKPRQTICTMEAKICPDGSVVGRSEPNCEFAQCPSKSPETSEVPEAPEREDNSGWRTATNTEQGITFQYPGEFPASYITPVNWPPEVTMASGTFFCDETPGTSSLPQRIIRRLIDGRVYCVEAMSEGAAGSVYTEYTYTAQRGAELIKLNFILQYPRCLNYDDPIMSACSNERETFDLDSMVDKIAQSASKL